VSAAAPNADGAGAGAGRGAVDLAAAAAALPDLWSPRVVARVNDQYLKVARVRGEFVWHAHADEDELFLVLRGRLRLDFEDGPPVTLGPGECHVVPRGVRHRPVADDEVWLALVEPVGTLHTGDVVTDRTRSIAEQLGAPAGAPGVGGGGAAG
jgi:mannose-6-phosphate isomerase-like protein (cupin superfamily)